jgi:hypothetical protein
MKHLLLPFVMVATLAACTSSSRDDIADASLLIENDSSFVLVDLRVAEINDPSWGPNLIGPDALFPGEAIEVFVDCGFYDVLIEDELGAVCELSSVDLCWEDVAWVITDAQLAACDAFFAARLSAAGAADAADTATRPDAATE